MVMTVTESAGSLSVPTCLRKLDIQRQPKKNQITFNSGYFQGSSHMKNITDYCQEESKRSKIFKLYLVAQCLQSPKRGSEDMITLFSYIQSNHIDVVL